MFRDATEAEQAAAVRAAVEAQRRRSGGRLADVGPDAALLGPGEAYVRALATSGKPVPAARLRPEALDGGPYVLLREGEEVRGYAALPEAIDAAVANPVQSASDEPSTPPATATRSSCASTGGRPATTAPAAPTARPSPCAPPPATARPSRA